VTDRPFDDHTLCLLNAAVWYVERVPVNIRAQHHRLIEIPAGCQKSSCIVKGDGGEIEGQPEPRWTRDPGPAR
jgi:hypothetical protein